MKQKVERNATQLFVKVILVRKYMKAINQLSWSITRVEKKFSDKDLETMSEAELQELLKAYDEVSKEVVFVADGMRKLDIG